LDGDRNVGPLTSSPDGQIWAGTRPRFVLIEVDSTQRDLYSLILENEYDIPYCPEIRSSDRICPVPNESKGFGHLNDAAGPL
jgi:hypothetical protein